MRISTIKQFDFDLEVRWYDHRAIAQCVRADRHDANGIELRLDDGPAATERIGRGAGRRRDDQAIPRMCIDILTGDRGLKVAHSSGASALQHDVFHGGSRGNTAVTCLEACIQHQSRLTGIIAVKDLTEALQHFIRRHVGEKAESPPVNAE